MKDYSELYENNIKVLNHAIACCDVIMTHNDIINELYSDDDIKKQLCLIELAEVNSQKEADILVYNLTGKSGPVREACSFKILELIKKAEYNDFFQTDDILDTFTKGIVDINPTVSRNVVEIIKYIKNSDYLIRNITAEINKTLASMEKIKQNRSYTANKKNFNLYWNLEALISLDNKITINDEIIQIINNIYTSNDYTIREKAAKFICQNTNPAFEHIQEVLRNDENIYVKKYFS